MADHARYWTPGFVETFVGDLRTDKSFQRAARNFSDTIVLRCMDTPDGKDVVATYVIDRGSVDVDLQTRDAPWGEMRGEKYDKKRCMARTTAPYDLWCRLDKGEINVVQAITSPEYRLEGSKLRVMRHIGLFNAMNAVAARVQKTY